MNIQKGLIGQFLAERFMINKGYRCVTCNYRYTGGEIDLVMKKSGQLFFVEIKTHIVRQITENVICETINNYSTKMNRAKLQRMRQGAEDYFVKHETSVRQTFRFIWVEVFITRVSYETLQLGALSVLHMKQNTSIELNKLLGESKWQEVNHVVRMIDPCLLCPL